jgi:hypothetical protein
MRTVMPFIGRSVLGWVSTHAQGCASLQLSDAVNNNGMRAVGVPKTPHYLTNLRSLSLERLTLQELGPINPQTPAQQPQPSDAGTPQHPHAAATESAEAAVAWELQQRLQLGPDAVAADSVSAPSAAAVADVAAVRRPVPLLQACRHVTQLQACRHVTQLQLLKCVVWPLQEPSQLVQPPGLAALTELSGLTSLKHLVLAVQVPEAAYNYDDDIWVSGRMCRRSLQHAHTMHPGEHTSGRPCHSTATLLCACCLWLCYTGPLYLPSRSCALMRCHSMPCCATIPVYLTGGLQASTAYPMLGEHGQEALQLVMGGVAACPMRTGSQLDAARLVTVWFVLALAGAWQHVVRVDSTDTPGLVKAGGLSSHWLLCWLSSLVGFCGNEAQLTVSIRPVGLDVGSGSSTQHWQRSPVCRSCSVCHKTTYTRCSH